MNALELIHRARAAGLTLEPVPGGLKVRGSKLARAAILPELRPLSGEIRQLLTDQPASRGHNSTAAPGLREPCDGCRRTDWVVTVITGCGDRLCPRCWRDTTTAAVGNQPATPRLDAAIAAANQRAKEDGEGS